ncbi:hypothetical protein SCANM124S_04909 [Streptomyces canus]
MFAGRCRLGPFVGWPVPRWSLSVNPPWIRQRPPPVRSTGGGRFGIRFRAGYFCADGDGVPVSVGSPFSGTNASASQAIEASPVPSAVAEVSETLGVPLNS